MSYNRDSDEALGKSLSVYQERKPKQNSIQRYFRQKKPCSNCPFRREGAIPLAEGRIKGIVDELMENDHSSFSCHKTVHGKNGGEFDDNGDYHPSGTEAMCAGAAAYLMRVGRPTIGMRLAFLTKDVSPSNWDHAMDDIIDVI